jgi:hypothetical protein
MTDTAETPRVLSLTEVGNRLRMKPSNVAKFLARHGVKPAFVKGQGYLWAEEDIERLRAAREADVEKRAADERRREAALSGPPPAVIDSVRLGKHQQQILVRLRQRPMRAAGDSERLALRRLVIRGLAEQVPGEDGNYQLSERGREVAAAL